ncbi:hypothetical protein GLOTRDRAFT_121828 [Gloeophyllum trabeum ATCC 11539]|uniref:RNA polymerase II-associated protein 1 C-terminal domain-containing protein n=1 Tax=Gloeophyllum trabeum (strain ATCC 11539 / FP-39264 / Madison 617) TaxID=670483 RepID=S7Q5X1_GLOTA|nr:uncharacterized protein GLOTRDRAFT_121828 [Gloeophyllum trabeum ATCC 11539]EPQ54872.1 hypothetical protein GLOTRDRAFT_121828 [Gloeophyllum trabeum ATCC 11539]
MDARGSLVGSVVERKPGSSSASAPKPKGPARNGFPTVEHRSKSAFARGREEARRKGGSERLREVPVVQATPREHSRAGAEKPPVTVDSTEEDWRRQVSEENQRRVESMSEEELEQERREILERFGAGVGDILRKVKEAREKRGGGHGKDSAEILGINTSSADPREKENEVVHEEVKRHADTLQHDSAVKSPVTPTSPRSALSRSTTRPSSRADRKLRFADLAPEDVHVYQSAPPSPKRKPLALMPPSASDREDTSIISLGEWRKSGGLSFQDQPAAEKPSSDTSQPGGKDEDGDVEEGTPEYIRKRFFPNMPADDPSLAWITSRPPPDPTSPSSLRFDLTGTPIPAALSNILPTHLGLHHHAEGTHAGYTIDDIFLLSRSTVPAQRATMLGVLARITRRLGKARKKYGEHDDGLAELHGKEEELRKRILAAGIEALGQRGSVGAMAVDVLWECVVGWDEELVDIEGVEFIEASTQSTPGEEADKIQSAARDAISSLPIEYLLPQIAEALSTAALPEASLSQLLGILHRLAQYSNAYATSITGTPKLLPSVVSTFLLTPIPPTSTSPLPNPLAIQLLATLAMASRSNASSVTGYADALLRFVVTLPPDSAYSHPLATALLASTLEFYTVLASYGLYASVATTATEHLHRLGNYVLSQRCVSKRLMTAWAKLLAGWIVCATDPHQTTPDHEILWSQVAGWGWGEQVLELRAKLEEGYQEVWAAVWGTCAAWLEGARVNGIKGGEQERARMVELVSEGFEAGKESAVVLQAVENLRHSLDQLRSIGSAPFHSEALIGLHETSKDAKLLSAALRLWLSCTPPFSEGPPPSPPFVLPFDDISVLAASLSRHSIWSCLQVQPVAAPPFISVFFRPLSSFLSLFIRLSRRLPGTSPDLWLAQACTVLQRVLPGDEDLTQRTLEQMMDVVTPGFIAQAGWNVPNIIWENGGMGIITPFFILSIRPQLDEEEEQYGYVGPLDMTRQSIALAATQRVPSISGLRSRLGRDFGVPLARDWPFIPLDHLLRSGTSAVFKALPSTWNASETDVTRAVLLLAKVVREVLRVNGFGEEFVMSREEVVFGCMRVFMLEHGQDQQNDGVQEEVFRDTVIGGLMGDLLAPFSYAVSASTPKRSSSETLEQVSRRFLGHSTPFYQYYTDFLGLYDAISFGHPLFAKLLLPPLSMRYPVDYRKLFWDDYHHALRTIRTPVEDVLTDDLSQYLYPVEPDKAVVAAYLRALVKPGTAAGFLRFVAVHHVAAHIWDDLRPTDATKDEERAEKLIKAVVTQASLDVVKELVLYRQVDCSVDNRAILVPPQCFEQQGPWKGERLQQAEKWGFKERLQGLLA